MGLSIISTVTAPTGSYDLTTLADVKAELMITDDLSDTWLSSVISRISAQIRLYCNRVFQVETLQDAIYYQMDPYPYQVPGGVMQLQLSRWPIVSIASVTINNQIASPLVLTQGTDFTVDPNTGILIRLNSYTGYPMIWEDDPTVIVYQAGYETVPLDLEDACIRLIKMKWFARTRDPLLKSTDDAGVGTQAFWVGSLGLGMMPPDIADLLDSYRVPVTA
jgi:hypothetical protein